MQKHFDAGDSVRLVEKGTAEVALGVSIDEKDAALAFLTDGREQPCGVRLADAAFEIEDCDDTCLGHRFDRTTGN